MMNSVEKTWSLYDLPSNIIERICQFLIDDPGEPYDDIIPGRVQDVLNLGATCWRFSELIKSSYLKFRLSLHFRFMCNQTTDPEVLLNFLTWVSSTSWKCTSIQFLMGWEVNWHLLQETIIPMLTKFDLVFSSNVKHLHIDSVRNFQEYGTIMDAISPLLSAYVVIELYGSLESVPFGVLSKLPLSDRVKMIHFSYLAVFPDNLPSDFFENIFRTFTNLKEIHLPGIRPDVSKLITSCKSVRRLFLNEVLCSQFGSEELRGFKFERIEHLEIFRLENDLKNQETLLISTLFSNLTSLSIVTGFNPNSSSFQLPPSCVTVKLNIRLLEYVTNCQYIKHLMLEQYDNEGRDRSGLLIANICHFKFKLDVFVYRNEYDETTSNEHIIEEIAVPLLESQPFLKVLVLDLDEPRYGSHLNQEYIEAAKTMEKRKTFLESQPCLVYFRLRYIFLVLKLSMKPELFSLIRKLDFEFDWRIAEDGPRYVKIQPDLFRISELTIT